LERGRAPRASGGARQPIVAPVDRKCKCLRAQVGFLIVVFVKETFTAVRLCDERAENLAFEKMRPATTAVAMQQVFASATFSFVKSL
jgi:hypothetical protein